MPLYFDTVLVEAFEDDSVAVVYLSLTLYLIVPPVREYFISVAVGLGETFDGFEARWNTYFFKFFNFFRVDIVLFPHLPQFSFILLVLSCVELFDELNLEGSSKVDL